MNIIACFDMRAHVSCLDYIYQKHTNAIYLRAYLSQDVYIAHAGCYTGLKKLENYTSCWLLQIRSQQTFIF